MDLQRTYFCGLEESEKDGEPRNQITDEVFKSEEGWHEIFNILFKLFIIQHLGLNYARQFKEI